MTVGNGGLVGRACVLARAVGYVVLVIVDKAVAYVEILHDGVIQTIEKRRCVVLFFILFDISVEAVDGVAAAIEDAAEIVIDESVVVAYADAVFERAFGIERAVLRDDALVEHDVVRHEEVLALILLAIVDHPGEVHQLLSGAYAVGIAFRAVTAVEGVGGFFSGIGPVFVLVGLRLRSGSYCAHRKHSANQR